MRFALLIVLLASCSSKQGEPAPSGLLRVDEVAETEACPAGGLAVHNGIDRDHSGTLETPEVQSTHYVCHGQSAVPAATADTKAESPVDQVSSDHDTMITQGNKVLAAGHFAMAIRIADKAMELKPDSEPALIMAATAACGLNETDRAQGYLAKLSDDKRAILEARCRALAEANKTDATKMAQRCKRDPTRPECMLD